MLIAGGAGFIGSYLTRRLSRSGSEIIVVDAFRAYADPRRERDPNLRDAFLSRATIECLDLLDGDRLAFCLAWHRPDVVINLAANPIVASADSEPTACRRDIVESTRNLVSAVAMVGCVRRFVRVSSSMVYGNFPEARVAETADTKPVNAYGEMKLTAERLVQELGSAEWSKR